MWPWHGHRHWHQTWNGHLQGDANRHLYAHMYMHTDLHRWAQAQAGTCYMLVCRAPLPFTRQTGQQASTLLCAPLESYVLAVGPFSDMLMDELISKPKDSHGVSDSTLLARVPSSLSYIALCRLECTVISSIHMTDPAQSADPAPCQSLCPHFSQSWHGIGSTCACQCFAQPCAGCKALFRLLSSKPGHGSSGVQIRMCQDQHTGLWTAGLRPRTGIISAFYTS